MVLHLQQKYYIVLILNNPEKRFLLSLHYNGNNIFLFVNATKVYQFKPKDTEIKDYALCLDNVSKYFIINNMKKKKKRIKKSCKIFSIDFNPILILIQYYRYP